MLANIPLARRTSLAAYQDFLVPGLLSWVLGAWLQQAHIGLGNSPLWLALAFIACLLILALTATRRWIGQACLWGVLFMLGGVYVARLVPYLEPIVTPHALHYFLQRHGDQYQAVITAHVIDSGSKVSAEANGLITTRKAIVQLDSLNDDLVQGRVQVSRLRLPLGKRWTSGQAVRLHGDLRAPRPAVFQGGYDEAAYLHGIGVEGILNRATLEPATPASQKRWTDAGWALLGWTEQCRHTVARLFASVLPSPQSQILGGMVLGDRAIPVDDDTRQRFIQTGLIHLLAASGMNVAVVTGGVLWLGQRLRWPRLLNIGMALAALALYCLLTGLPPSIVRSGAMLALALTLKAIDKQLSPLLLFCIAVAAIVTLQPNVLLSLGFQFSCLTTLAIIALVPVLQPIWGHYMGRFWAGLLLIPLVAQLSITPISVSTFNTVSMYAIPMNLLALPLTAGLTLLGFVSALLGLFVPWAGVPVAQGLAWLSLLPLNGLLWLVRWGSTLPGSQWHIVTPDPWVLAAQSLGLGVAAAMACGWLLPQWPALRKLNVLLLGMLVLLLPGIFSPETHALRLVWLPVSSRQGAWVVHPASASQPLVLLAMAPDWKERKTLEDYLSHRAVSAAATWIAADWALPLPAQSSARVTAHLGSTRLSWPSGSQTDPSVRLLSQHYCVELGPGPSALSLSSVPRFRGCSPHSRWHALLTPTAKKLLLDPKTQQLMAYSF